MARPIRVDIADGVYHVISRGIDRQDIFREDADRVHFLDRLAEAQRRFRLRIFAYVLMSNHFHLFLRTPEPNLSAGMHDLNSGFASLFNRRHGRAGSLFQGRFKAILVEDQTHAWELSRYVHLNPVRAKMVPLPEAYRWSSYGVYRFARAAKGAFSWLDWKTVLAEHAKDLQQPEDANVPQRQRLVWRPTKAQIVGLVENHFGVDACVFRQVRRRGSNARTAALSLIRRLTQEKVTTPARSARERHT